MRATRLAKHSRESKVRCPLWINKDQQSCRQTVARPRLLQCPALRARAPTPQEVDPGLAPWAPPSRTAFATRGRQYARLHLPVRRDVRRFRREE
eukprot:Skav200215  [mRNA]  locus=scaffold714:61598:64173:+ [translate_table: standard]